MLILLDPFKDNFPLHILVDNHHEIKKTHSNTFPSKMHKSLFQSLVVLCCTTRDVFPLRLSDSKSRNVCGRVAPGGFVREISEGEAEDLEE